MTLEDNSSKLLAIRFALGTPLIIIILYATTIWSTTSIEGTFQWYYGFSVIVSLSLLIMFLISRAGVPKSSQEERSVEYFIEELQYQEKVYIIPTICTQCKTPIELNRVRWEDEYTPCCQECQSEIELRILEK